MAKTLKQILDEVNEPKAGDEKRFKDKHVIAKHADANGNGDDVFNGKNVKMADRKKHRKGYNPEEDKEHYEEIERRADFKQVKVKLPDGKVVMKKSRPEVKTENNKIKEALKIGRALALSK